MHRLARSAGLSQPSGCKARIKTRTWGRRHPGRGRVRARWPAPGPACQRAHTQPPSRAPARAGQHARAPRTSPPKMEGRRIMGHVTSPEKMHRGASPLLDNYSMYWNPPFGRISPPLPSSSVLRPNATPAPGTGADPPASAHVRGRDPGRGPGHASQRAYPRPPSRAPVRAGQHAWAPRSALPERDGRRIMGNVASPEKMHRGAIALYGIITAWIGIPRADSSSHPILKCAAPVRNRRAGRAPADPGRGPGHSA